MMATPRQRNQPNVAALPTEMDVPLAKHGRGRSATQILQTYDQTPIWHQDNEYIRSGYRLETNSARQCLASWWYIHSETANIFTHLIPTLVSMLCGMMVFPFFNKYYPASTTGDKLVFAFFLFAAAICLGMSATYHTLMNHSSSVSELWLRLDYVGIVILTLGDFVSGIYLIFYCERALQRVYWTMVSDYTDPSSCCSFGIRLMSGVDYHALFRDSHDIG